MLLEITGNNFRNYHVKFSCILFQRRSTVGETSVATAAAHQTFTWQHVDILKYSEFLEVPCEQNNWNLKQRHVMGVCAVSEAKFMWVIVTKD